LGKAEAAAGLSFLGKDGWGLYKSSQKDLKKAQYAMAMMRFAKPTEHKDFEEVEWNYDEIRDFEMDHDGYFLIKVDRQNKKIVVGFCKQNNEILVKIIGKKPSDIYHAVLKKGLIKRADHAAYLGKECQKAYIALHEGIDYVQDEELDFSRKVQ
jgi:dihydropteroate synthase